MDLEQVFAEADEIYGAPRKRPKTVLSNQGPFFTIANVPSTCEEVDVEQLHSENENLKKLTSSQGKQLESLKDVEDRCKIMSDGFEQLKEEHRGLRRENKNLRKKLESNRREIERQKTGEEEIRAVRKENEQLKNDLRTKEKLKLEKAWEQEIQGLRKENEQLKNDLHTKETELNSQNRWEQSTYHREKQLVDREKKIKEQEESARQEQLKVKEKDEQLRKLIHIYKKKMATKLQLTELLEREKKVKEDEENVQKDLENLKEEQRLFDLRVKQLDEENRECLYE